MATRYTELTGCRVPVQQAPMGSVSTTALAVAVAQAGGVGSITVLGMSPGQVDKVLGGMAARTDGVLAACPLCATSPRARVLRSCVSALGELSGDTVGERVAGGGRVPVPRGHGTPPGAAATGHIEAMPMYAGESAAAITAVEPAAAILEAWVAAV
jgi:NAD(P)H-dependent flavin oxidoreductase YrpB (nitropropane dioxygenase family)